MTQRFFSPLWSLFAEIMFKTFFGMTRFYTTCQVPSQFLRNQEEVEQARTTYYIPSRKTIIPVFVHRHLVKYEYILLTADRALMHGMMQRPVGLFAPCPDPIAWIRRQNYRRDNAQYIHSSLSFWHHGPQICDQLIVSRHVRCVFGESLPWHITSSSSWVLRWWPSGSGGRWKKRK